MPAVQHSSETSGHRRLTLLTRSIAPLLSRQALSSLHFPGFPPPPSPLPSSSHSCKCACNAPGYGAQAGAPTREEDSVALIPTHYTNVYILGASTRRCSVRNCFPPPFVAESYVEGCDLQRPVPFPSGVFRAAGINASAPTTLTAGLKSVNE